MWYIYSEITNVKRIYICISHWNFIVIRSETKEEMDFKGHYPQNTISHCIISNETQITLHFFQGRISAMPDTQGVKSVTVRGDSLWQLSMMLYERVTGALWFP